MKIFSSFTLKIIAILTMTLDHIYTYMGKVEGVDIPIWFGYLGKLAAPIFFYLIIEGFFHTRSRSKYLIRLASFGAVMVGVDAVLDIHNNIFLSLALSVATMMLFENIKENKKRSISIVGVIITLALFMFTEASIHGLVMTLIFYFFRDKKILMSIFYIVYSLFPVMEAVGSSEMYDMLFLFDYQWMMVFAIPLILMYNGKLGLKNTFTKWMFYIFYPAHLIIIVLITKMI